MPAYAYPITIELNKKAIAYDTQHEIDASSLTLDMLRPIVGTHRFTVKDADWSGYVITVHQSRLETDDEQAARIAKEQRYMDEYHKRHKEK